MCTSVIAFGIFWNRRDPELALLKHFKRCFAVINILINIVYFWTLVRGRILGGWSQSTKMFCLKTFLPHTLSWGQHLFSFFFFFSWCLRLDSAAPLTWLKSLWNHMLFHPTQQSGVKLFEILFTFFFFDIPSQTNDVMPQHYSFFFFLYQHSRKSVMQVLQGHTAVQHLPPHEAPPLAVNSIKVS